MTNGARRQLEDVILPFWLENGVDDEYGGFFTCFDNRGRQLLSTDKFTWSQGRFVWLLARAARLADTGLLDLDADIAIAIAERGAAFLLEHAVHDDGTAAFILDRTGRPRTGPGSEQRSVYADCFVAMGLAELARQTKSPDWLQPATAIIERASHDIHAGTAPTPPYPIPSGYSAFGPWMILANTRLEQARAVTELGLDDADDVRAALDGACRAMLAHRSSDGQFLEMIPAADLAADTLVARHRVPGHAIEGLWVALEAGELTGETARTPELLASVDVLCSSAWDSQAGGLFRYIDAADPCQPTGTTHGTEYEDLVQRTWDMKLWWVHTEAAYTTALAAWRYGLTSAQGWFNRIWSYTLATFPGGDEGEEWIQIRDRRGDPIDQLVALPVKDPFHIARNLMQLVELDVDSNLR